ncbi:MAG: pectate lyase-like adhesive domain-containing protein, partial [Coprobacillaceae bacterium]
MKNKKVIKKLLLIFLVLGMSFSSLNYYSIHADTEDQIESQEEENDEENEEVIEEIPEVIPETDTTQEIEEPEEEAVNDSEITPLDIGLFSNAVEVSSWGELRTAMSTTEVDYIRFTKDIIREGSTASSNDLPEITRSLTIDGNGYILDFTTVTRASFQLGTVASQMQFTLANLQIKRNGAGYLVSAAASNANWEANFHNVSNVSGSNSRLVTLRNGVVNFTGKVSWLLPNSSYDEVIYTRYMYIKDGAVVDLSTNTGQGIIRLNPSASSGAITGLEVTNASKLTIKTAAEQAIFANNNSTSLTQNTVYFKVLDGSHVDIESTGSSSGDDGGVIVICGSTIDESNPSGIIVGGGSTLEVDSQGAMPALIQQVTNGGVFNVDGAGSALNLYSSAGDSTYGATIRFRRVGKQQFNVTNNAEVNIIKSAGSRAPAIRFYGDDNAFNVSGGSKVFVENQGDGTPRNGGSNATNQAIQYQSASSASFSVTGEGSAISIIAANGCALDMDDSNATIEATEGAVFNVEGNTASKDAAVINGRNLDFYAKNILYYDFVNNRSGGGLVFKTSNGTTSKLESINSDVAVWKIGDNIEGNPYKTWTLIDYKLTGQDYTTIESSSDETFNSSNTSFGSAGMTAYTRISGNNAAPIIDEFRIPENTDQSIFGHAVVPEGLDLVGRDAWTDEVYVKIKETTIDGIENYYYAKTIGKQNDDPGLIVYGEDARGGMYTVSLGEFIVTGNTYEVVEAWRGEADPLSTKRHISSSKDILTGIVTAIDKTPNLPVNVTNILYDDGNYIGGTWQLDAKHNTDKPTILTVSLNEQMLSNQGIINEDGTWSYTFPEGTVLTAGDKVQVFLTDENGNVSPVTETKYHDATFLQSTIITVIEQIYTISAQDVIIGLDDAKTITTNQDLIDAAKAEGFDKSINQSTNVKVKSSEYKPEEGKYKVVFCVENAEEIQKEVIFEVLPYDVVVTTDEYIIAANHAHIFTGEATKIEKEDAYAKTQLKVLTDVIGWTRIERTEVEVSLVNHTVKGSKGLYSATFKINDDETVQVSPKITVTTGDAPIITAPTPKEIQVGDSFDEWEGVSAYDTEDLDITSKITITGEVKNNEEGIYELTYTVTDSDNNTDTKVVTVVVNDGSYLVKDGYILKATSFTKKIKDVDTSEEAVRIATELNAWRVDENLGAVRVTSTIVSTGGYKAEEGSYPIVVNIEEKEEITKTVYGIVVPDDAIISEDKDYVIYVQDAEINTTVAKELDNDKVTNLTNAKGYNKNTGVLEPIQIKGGAHNVGITEGDYLVTFEVVSKPSINVTPTVKVNDGEAP